MEDLICEFCKQLKKSSKSLKAHRVTCTSNPDRKYKSGTLGKSSWNKGLTKETNEVVKRSAEKLKGISKRGSISDAGKERLSLLAKEKGLGGYRPHPNRGIRYNGIWFDSKWEVRLAESLDQNHIRWERPKTGFVWNSEGNKYYPDFYLIDYDVYLDPKNSYLQKVDKTKIEAASALNGIRVLVLSEEQLDWTIIAPIVQW